MRRSLAVIFIQAFILLSFIWNVPFASADTGILGQSTCPSGSNGDPSGSQSFQAGGPNVAGAVKTYLTNVELCASACYDETISVTFALSTLTLTLNTAAKNMCKSAPPNPVADNRGCSKGQTQPLVTVNVPASGVPGINAQTIGPKSRCLASVSTTIGSLMQGGINLSNLNPTSVQNALTTINNEPALATPLAASGSVAGNSILISALTSSGVPAAAAQTLAADPASAQALINAYATGNADTIQDTIQDASDKAGINLNDSVYDSVAGLSSSQLQSAQSTLSPLADSSGTYPGSSTFSQGQTDGSSGIADQTSGLCAQMGGCGTCKSGSLVCQTNNPGALTWSSWETKYGGYQCGMNNNTTCFPSMEQGIAAQANLLTTSSCYYGSGSNTILGAMCGNGGSCPGYAVGYSSNACATYATAIQNYTGVSMNQTIDPNDSATIAKIMMAQSRVESGYGVVYSPTQLESGLSILYGGSIPSATPSTAPSTSAPAGGSFSSPFTITSSSGAGTGNVAGSSPFANVSPFSTNTSTGNTQALLAAGSSFLTGLASGSGSSSSNSTTVAGSATPTSPATPIAQISAQPASVPLNGSITLAWSSGGMSATEPCEVFESGDATPLAQENAGLQNVTATTTGTVAFELACTSSINGQLITTQSQPVTVN